MINIADVEKLRTFFRSGAVRTREARIGYLKKFRSSILSHEEELYEALQTDLGKCKEEVWATETGLVLAELNYTIKHLRRWMTPESVGTNLVNFPSSSRILKEPMGVVLIIGPWNYPFQLVMVPLIGAIAAGNTVVMKPSEFSPATNAVIKKIITEVFPPDYVMYVEGEGAVVVPELMNGFRFDHVFYTGSPLVGKIIYTMAASQLVPVTLELGGKSPCIIEPDANIKVAARRIAMTKFSNAGQMCVAPDYVLVHASVKDEMLKALQAQILAFFGEDPSKSYNYGKIINDRQFSRLSAYLGDGTIFHGGKTDRATRYIEPTLMTDLKPDAGVMRDEIFGPILPVIPFNTREEALAIIEQHPNPLAMYVYTASRKKEEEWLKDVPAGGGCVNNSSWQFANHHLPAGGRGNSGIGNYHGRASFDTFSHRKSILKTPTWFDPSFKYPPFKGKLKWFKKIIR